MSIRDYDPRNDPNSTGYDPNNGLWDCPHRTNPSLGTMTNLDVANLLELANRLTVENADLKAQLNSLTEDKKDLTISFECVKAMLKTYMDFFEATATRSGA